ncbi:hypothetical protein C1645_835476 [Glomus cerebriforme]|uniref:Uncharacterized protein n=1 Tax=Glomus cerebriforme TaxID=658196 RepID=A0A397SDM4_9GLOM|nr:hypothetical protein C1645_835476 [Glomus cerebriforme]
MISKSSYQIISEDLQELTPIIIKLPFPFMNNAITLKDQVKELFKQLKRTFVRNNREEALLNAFYIGQISEVLADNLTERAICRSVLTPYYQKNIESSSDLTNAQLLEEKIDTLGEVEYDVFNKINNKEDCGIKIVSSENESLVDYNDIDKKNNIGDRNKDNDIPSKVNKVAFYMAYNIIPDTLKL